MIKVAVIGSCVSREVFNRKFVPEYKEYYQCVSTAWQTSIISFLSKPLKLTKDELITSIELNKHRTNTMLRDLSKEYVQEFLDTKPDYILVDFYADMRYGVVKKDNGFVTNNPNGFRKTAFFTSEKFESKLNYSKDTTTYFNLMTDKFHELYLWVNDNLPKCKIIINCFQYANSYLDQRLENVMFDPKKYNYLDKQNKEYNNIYIYLMEKYGDKLRYIDNRGRNYIGDGEHPFGVTPWHYNQQYYLDTFASLNKIVLKDMIIK